MTALPERISRPVRSRRMRGRSLGVEEELLLVDADTLVPTPASPRALAAAAKHRRPSVGRGRIEIEHELKREQIEVVGPPVRDRATLAAGILAGRRAADRAARAAGARAVPLATAPQNCRTHLVEDPRYDRMRERFPRTIEEQLTCGFHVHVGIESDREGVAVLDRIRSWLPLLLAMSANSPFWQGDDSSFASYRYQMWGRWPTAGPYDVFGTPEEYRAEVHALLDAGVCLDIGMIYFDARLSAHAPTVEVRIADVCLRPEDAATVAILVRALVERSIADADAGLPAPRVQTGMLRLASWRASRFGVGEQLLHPLTLELLPAADALAALLDHVDPGFVDEAERRATRAGVAEILRRGSGAVQQRRAAASGGLANVVADALATGLDA
ncbi:glutamate--cysteine ligase [Microbacterium sp. X-17]|uniref:glutamate--cysteine ligase n=1 Tax=Microbacterium sp. X-17 TaxID=3144404 RepID=UPI0031F51F49